LSFCDICVVDREACPNERPFLHFQQHTEGSETVTLKDRFGDGLTLSAYGQISLLARDTFGGDLYLNIVATKTDNKAVFSLTPADLPNPGVFLGEVVIESNAGVAVFRILCYVEVTESIELTGGTYPLGILTTAEVRMAIMDRCAEDNFLLDNVEFSDAQIAWAIRRPIDMWNETPPPVPPTYTPLTFPYRYHWSLAVIGMLMRAAGLNYKRNSLEYKVSGMSIDDKHEAEFYVKMGNAYMKEYTDWMRHKKVEINMGRALGTTGVPVFGSTRV